MRLRFLSRFALLVAGSLTVLGATVAPRPNIVFILADDLGWSDLTSYGSTFHETPHLDRLATQGVRFTQTYAASNVCSPTRASLLTGRHPARVGITDWIVGRPDRPDQKLARPPFLHQLPLEEVTLAEVFRTAGYRTGFIGKWHLGEDAKYFPEHQGFDVNIAGCGKGHPPSYFSPYKLPTLTDGPVGEHLDDRLTREAIDFVSAAAAKNQPFLLYLSHYAVHTPLQAKPELIAKYAAKLAAQPPAGPAFVEHPQDGRVRAVQSHATYAAMIESLDTSVGRLVAKLDELGLRENTIIVFTSDNGGLSTAEGSPTSNLPLRAGKGWAYEGGVREPLIVSWPGHLPAGRTTDAIVTSPDFFPTLLELAGLPAEPRLHVDGASFAAGLRDPAAPPVDRPVYWHYPHYSNQRGKPHGAVRAGRWKLIEWFEDGRVELFDLSTDLAEANDVSRAHPEITVNLIGQLQAWRQEVGARLPTPNPGYRPAP